jgi:hypothetical protein
LVVQAEPGEAVLDAGGFDLSGYREAGFGEYYLYYLEGIIANPKNAYLKNVKWHVASEFGYVPSLNDIAMEKSALAWMSETKEGATFAKQWGAVAAGGAIVYGILKKLGVTKALKGMISRAVGRIADKLGDRAVTASKRRLTKAVAAARLRRRLMFEAVQAGIESADIEKRLPAQIAKRYQNKLVAFNRGIPDPSGFGNFTELDVELSNVIIEVTAGKGKHKPGQAARQALIGARLNKPIILYAPNITSGRARAYMKAGGKQVVGIARTAAELEKMIQGLK